MTLSTTSLVDSHCHLNFLDDPAAAITRARAAGVNHLLCIGVDQPGIADVLALAEPDPHIWASAGLHPESASRYDPETTSLAWLSEALAHPSVVAVGEMGLDYMEADAADRARQQHWFAEQLDLAKRVQLPVVVHTRGAVQDTLDLIEQSGVRSGVLHCFTEDWAMAEAALELGFYISISGIVTFKNAANVQSVAKRVPLDRLLIETDSPWLAPAPHRGKPNEPALLSHTAEFLAQLRDIPSQTLVAATSRNFFQLFRLQP